MEQLAPGDTSAILRELGYDYYVYREDAVRPEFSGTMFSGLLPGLASSRDPDLSDLSNRALYRHQEEAYNALQAGRNLILRSGTGSGKTEAWLLHVAKSGVRALAVYPTLALSNDQIRRIVEISRVTGLKVEALDALRRDDMVHARGRAALRSAIGELNILVTNPAFLMNEVKKLVAGSRGRLMDRFLSSVGLIVIDELDFYGPREIALLLSMLRLLKDAASGDFRVAVLTATLRDPGPLAEFLRGLTGHEVSVVEGMPFRVENRVYVVLGKDLRGIWDELRSHEDELRASGSVGDDVLEALHDYEKFRLSHFKVIEAARALGIGIPGTEYDPVEILRRYADDPVLTLVFTRNIAKAEELGRKLRSALPPELQDRVAVHHHLASRAARAEREERARRGEVKVLISPKTLSQGLDIGLVGRIVHVGLPESVREFIQKEGRKGRRESLAYSETVVFPLYAWDRELLSRGVETLRRWMELQPERALVNPRNRYMTLFESLARFTSPSLRQSLPREGYEFLMSMGLVEGNELTDAGKRVWRNMNFYEFAPPFGVKRLIDEEPAPRYLEDVSHCDLVEKFQPGSIDYSADGVVVEHRRAEGAVTAIVERRLSERALWDYEPLAQAYEEYEKAKFQWRERPNIVSDYMNGRLHSDVRCVVYPPRKGFGRYDKIPNRVLWRIYSSQPIVRRISGRTSVRRDMRVVDVPASTSGRYSDYTYGVGLELDPAEDVNLLRIGLAYILIILRRKHGISLDALQYDLGKVGEKKYMGLHEPESSGLLEELDWAALRSEVESYLPDDLDDVLMSALDEYAYADFLGYGLRWDLARAYALRAIDYLLLQQRVVMRVRGRLVSVPKPSRALKLLSMDALSLPLDDEERVRLIAVATYDGEESSAIVLKSEFGLLSGDGDEVRRRVFAAVDSGFRVLVYDMRSTLDALNASGMASLAMLLRQMSSEHGLVEVRGEISGALEEDVPLSEADAAILGRERKVGLAELRREYEYARSRIRGIEYAEWEYHIKYLNAYLEEFVRENAESALLLHLAADRLRGP
ncbi:MAG: DEAD/DEAH box helicase [Nitrososphaeria archaeon]